MKGQKVKQRCSKEASSELAIIRLHLVYKVRVAQVDPAQATA